jgi:hypothetical protein
MNASCVPQDQYKLKGRYYFCVKEQFSELVKKSMKSYAEKECRYGPKPLSCNVKKKGQLLFWLQNLFLWLYELQTYNVSPEVLLDL